MRKSTLLRMLTAHFTGQKQVIIISFLLTLCGCTKDPIDHKTDNIRQEFTVVETNSNMPIQGVTVSAYACGGTLCSGLGPLLATAITNDSGKVVFNTSGIVSLKLSKDKYWPDEAGLAWAISSFELTPIATLKVHLTRVNQYPAGYILNLWVPGGDGGSLNNIKQLTAPRDGVIYFNGRGNCGNVIGWSVDDPVGPQNFTPSIQVNRFDTAELSIEY